VLTGDIHGYLEPCGCSERQTGGFARRADLFRQLRVDKKWPVTALDVGGSLNDQRVKYPQSKIKFDIIREAMNTIGYKAMGLGAEELMLGPSDLYTAHTTTDAIDGFDMPMMASNVTIFGSPDLGTPIPTRLIEINGIKIGVTAVTGDTIKQKLAATGLTANADELAIQSPSAVLPAAIEKLQSEGAQLLVLLSHSDIDESTELAKAYPEFQIVVTAHSAEDPKKEAQYVGNTMLVHVGKKGKNAAVVGLFPGAEQALKLQMVEIDVDRFKNDPRMVALMEKYQGQLKDAYPQLVNDQQAIADPGDQFAGADACKTCHTYAYGIWSKTKHAHAFESLSTGRPGQDYPPIPRIFDPECLCCHTTGWDPQSALRHRSGFVSLDSTAHLAGQQCENCHGPASTHVQLENGRTKGSAVSPEVQAARAKLHLTKALAKEQVCSKCHDHDNSPKFDFDQYWPKVNHSGKRD